MKLKERELIIFLEILIGLKIENHHYHLKNALGKDQGVKHKVILILFQANLLYSYCFH